MQAVVIPISTDKHLDYARDVTDRLKEAGLRVEIDEGKDRMQAKICHTPLHRAGLYHHTPQHSATAPLPKTYIALPQAVSVGNAL